MPETGKTLATGRRGDFIKGMRGECRSLGQGGCWIRCGSAPERAAQAGERRGDDGSEAGENRRVEGGKLAAEAPGVLPLPCGDYGIRGGSGFPQPGAPD